MPNIISRAQWGADESMRGGAPLYDNGIKAGIVHHTATTNDHSPADSAAIVRGIYGYHTRMLHWGDIAYNALVDKYGQVFEGRFGGMTRSVEGTHTGGFNKNTWAVAMIGNFVDVPPTPAQLRSVGLLLGWRLAMDGVDPRGTVRLTSEGGPYTFFPQGAAPILPNIFAHRDVGGTACPGTVGYQSLDRIRDIAARFNKPATSQDLADALQGGAIYARWQAMGGMTGPLGAPTSPETPGEGSTRYVTFDKGAIYWSPKTGAAPVTGAIYDAWASLGFERSALGLPTSAEIQEPEWIVQNFAHGTLNLDRQNSTVTRVIDGVPLQLPPPSPSGPPVQLERFSPARSRV
ncbi:MAG: N-acetylmuramoyl-L-alanine amidase [Mycobacterium sp.]|nr:N-acetylmuramoyl-L-alanine amidase [Mycobacterium sp.]